MQQIARGIYYEDSYLGVTLGALVFSHGVIMIDAPLRAEDARSWRSALLNQRGGANRLLINLDAHPDRTLGARAMDTTILAHAKAALVFRTRPTIFKGQTVESGAEWETYNDAIGMRWATPDITFSQQMALHWGGPEVILEHHPGPAPGAIWVIIPAERVIFVGDTVVVDQPPMLANAEVKPWLESLEQLQESYRDYVIISGRGGPVVGDLISSQQSFLSSVEEEMDRLVGQNATPEATEELISSLLSGLSFSGERREQYVQRLRYGLYQYYSRRYHPGNTALEQSEVEEEE